MSKERDVFYDVYDSLVYDDIEINKDICDLAGKMLRDRFKIRVEEDAYQIIGVAFNVVYFSILELLKSKQADYSNYKINFCDRLEIGYSTNEDDDDEKQGNFVIFIRHLNKNTVDETKIDTEPNSSTVQLCASWNDFNVTNQIKDIKIIEDMAMKNLKDVDIAFNSPELIMPIFITTYEAVVEHLKLKRIDIDSFELEINFMSCFNIGVREGEGGIDVVYIRPNIDNKLKMKDDQKASSKFE